MSTRVLHLIYCIFFKVIDSNHSIGIPILKKKIGFANSVALSLSIPVAEIRVLEHACQFLICQVLFIRITYYEKQLILQKWMLCQHLCTSRCSVLNEHECSHFFSFVRRIYLFSSCSFVRLVVCLLFVHANKFIIYLVLLS